MENAMSSLLLQAAPYALLFCNTVFLWTAMLRKSSFSLRSFCSPFAPLFTSRSPHHHVETSKRAPAISPPSTTVIGREDVERVMEVMGLSMEPRSGEDDADDLVDFAELADTFVEREPTLHEVQAAFAAFDANGDGYIDPEELRRVLCGLGFGVASELRACEDMIAAHDENGDGRIDFDEFVKFFERSSFCC